MEICGKVTLLQDPGSQFLAQSLQAFSQPSSLPPVCACVKKNNQSKNARPLFIIDFLSLQNGIFFLLSLLSFYAQHLA